MDDSTAPNPPPLRLPNPAYRGKNGFDVGFTEPIDPADTNALTQALDRHRLAQRILETKGRPIPRYDSLHGHLCKILTEVYDSFEDMQKYAERIETPATIRETIKELQEEHLEDLTLLYDYHAADYIQDMKDLYVSYDDTVYLEEGERAPEIVASCRRLEVRLTLHC